MSKTKTKPTFYADMVTDSQIEFRQVIRTVTIAHIRGSAVFAWCNDSDVVLLEESGRLRESGVPLFENFSDAIKAAKKAQGVPIGGDDD